MAAAGGAVASCALTVALIFHFTHNPELVGILLVCTLIGVIGVIGGILVAHFLEHKF